MIPKAPNDEVLSSSIEMGEGGHPQKSVHGTPSQGFFTVYQVIPFWTTGAQFLAITS